MGITMPFLDLPFDRPEELYGSFARAFAKEMNETFENIHEIEDKALFLVIGATGAGKSSFINHMLGYSFEQKRKGRYNSYEIKVDGLPFDAKYAGMGSRQSVTTAASLYTKGDIAWCDTPGFFGTDEGRHRAEAFSL